MRGIKAMISAAQLPRFIPGTGMAGEKANDKSVGANVLLYRLVRPNTKPNPAPIFGPRRMEPMMTGTWTIVAFMSGSCIYPIGVKFRRMIIPTSRA